MINLFVLALSLSMMINAVGICSESETPQESLFCLPEELMVKITEHLIDINDEASLASLRCVTRQWRRIVEYLDLETPPINIFFLGTGGVGKSTVLHLFAGIPLETYLSDTRQIIFGPTKGLSNIQIGHGYESCTLSPVKVGLRSRKTLIDCPGFQDSRGEEADQDNILEVSRLVSDSSDNVIKIVLVVTAYEIKSQGIRKLKNVLDDLKKFIPNQNILKNHLSLVISDLDRGEDLVNLKALLNPDGNNSFQKEDTEILRSLINNPKNIAFFYTSKSPGRYEVDESLRGLINILLRPVKAHSAPAKLFLLGNSGCGKSTLAHVFAQIPLQTEYLSNVRQFVLTSSLDVENFGAEINHGYRSSCANPVEIQLSHSTSLFDCPGFNDTRGRSIDAKNASNIYNLLREPLTKLRIVLLVSVLDISSQNGNSFIRLIHTITSMFPNQNQLKNALSLVIGGGKPEVEGIDYLERLLESNSDSYSLSDDDRALLEHFIRHPENVSIFPKYSEVGPYIIPASLNALINNMVLADPIEVNAPNEERIIGNLGDW